MCSLRIEPDISSVSIVLAGGFNPVIFTPAWFTLYNLLPENSAELEIVHRQVTKLRTDWMELFVTPERFHIETLKAPYARIRDLVLRIFKEQLNHTPLSAFGINRNVHFRVKSRAIRDQMGRTLAPVEPWGDWKNRLGLDNEHGGMTSLTMSQTRPDDRPEGDRISVTVGPSVRVGDGKLGIYVMVNDHHVIDGPAAQSCEVLVGSLEENFEASIRRSADVIDHVMSLAETRER